MKEREGTIYIVDDDNEICKALSWLFGSIDLPVETYTNPKNFLDQFNAKRHGCLIIDVRTPFMSGLELIDTLKSQKKFLPTIVMTGHGDISMAVRAMKAGAIDFLLKPINEQYLIEAAQKCLKLSSSNFNSTEQFQDRASKLTERERQVLDLILEGKLNKEIASLLNISISTVEAHRARVMQKMEAKSLTHLVKLSLQHHYLS